MADDRLAKIETMLAALCAHMGVPGYGRPASGARGASAPSGGGEIAPDRDLDSEWGDPLIKKDPPRWEGQSFVGVTYSRTTPEYLDALASFHDWRADKDDAVNAVDGKGRKKSTYARRDAARARGWAQRLRNGWRPPQGTQEAAPDDYADPAGDGSADAVAAQYDDDIPF